MCPLSVLRGYFYVIFQKLSEIEKMSAPYNASLRLTFSSSTYPGMDAS